MVKAIIFDCFGVLTTDYWKEFVATLPSEQVDPARSLNYQYAAARLTREQFMERIKELTGRLPTDNEELHKGDVIKNTPLLKYIAELKKEFKVGLLSNIGSSWIRDSFLEPAEQNLFDLMVLSYEVQLAKPDAEIFELTAERLGEKAQDCVFIDDSPGHCEAAARLGMKAIVYENFEQMKRVLEPLLNPES